MNSTSSLLGVTARAIQSGHFHGKPFDCDGIIDANEAVGCCIIDIDGLVVTIVVNGACFGGLCNTDGLLSVNEKGMKSQISTQQSLSAIVSFHVLIAKPFARSENQLIWKDRKNTNLIFGASNGLGIVV